MIPFAVKQVWFWLALTGLVQCWITLIYFGRKVGGLWGRLYYCVFVTLLEGIFCIGMVWHMDPSRMPRAFCIAQVIAFSLGSFALTGLCASFALACARAVFRPGSVNTGRAVLAWHHRYIPLLIFFPVAASITHATLLITLDAVQPELSDDLHCDATDPLWMRMVGYSGVPLLITIPFLVLSVLTAYRLYKVRRIHSTRSTYTVGEGEDYDDYGPSDLHTYDLQGQKRRSAISLNAFLPYPSKAWFKRNSTIPPPPESVNDKDPVEYPLHQHPFPAVDPLTGSAYSPSLEEQDAASLTVQAASLRMERGHQHDSSATNPRNLSPHGQSRRDQSSTPDSTASSTMPIFATNPKLLTANMKSSTNVAMASGSSLILTPTSPVGDSQVGLAVTTGDSPGPWISPEQEIDEGGTVGLAVTTDEPERMSTPTPIHRIRTPSPLKNTTNATPTPSDTPTMRDTLHPQDADSMHDHPGSGLQARDRSPDSVARTVSSGGHHPSHPILQAPPANHPSSFPIHRRQPSFVSSGTFYSTAFAYTDADREDRDLLPFSSPASASTFQSPTTPKDHDMDLTVGSILSLRQTMSRDRDGDTDRYVKDTKSLEWEEDGYHAHNMPMRTVKRRDPRERLGVYNPTPPMGPTALTIERRRQTLRKEMPIDRSAKLGSAIWRMILFQIAFFSIQLLACLSTVLDLARHTITPFGTQHVALILAAWGPLCIFAQMPKLPRFLKRRQ